MQGRMGVPVRDDAQTARASRPRCSFCQGTGTGRPVRNSSLARTDLGAARTLRVRASARQDIFPECDRIGRRTSRSDEFLPVRDVRPLSEAQARYPGSRRRMDQLLARPDGRGIRQHRRTNGPAQGASELLLQAQRLDFGRPDEHSLPAMVQLCGADKFFWASDFPHADHTGNYMEELEELADKLPEAARAKVLGENVLRVYNCDDIFHVL